MADTHKAVTCDKLECCPPLECKPSCDTLDLRYRLPFRRREGRVDVILHFRLERCAGPLTKGDLAYSTTLFPGEQVRLFTSDRHTRWSFDSSTQLSYRHETTSEESFFSFGMARAMSDLNISESGGSSTKLEEDWSSGGGGLSVDIGIIDIGGGGGGGSYDAESTSSFARNLSRHAESSSSYVAAGVRAKSSTSVGEVEQRTHAEGESESHFESSSRVFSNPNQCHAITYFFYKINKCQKIRFRLVGIERVVSDTSAPTTPDRRLVPNFTGSVVVRPQAVLATSKDRVEVERIAREASVERERAARGIADSELFGNLSLRARGLTADREPISLNIRQALLKGVNDELINADIIDKAGKPTAKIIADLSWEREELLPTPGLLVKGCLDDCNICEPELQKKMALEIENQQLKNDLLRRQIELLDKAQEYRCCPEGEAETEPADDD